MAKKRFLFGMLAMSLVFGMAVIGCDSGVGLSGDIDAPETWLFYRQRSFSIINGVAGGVTSTTNVTHLSFTNERNYNRLYVINNASGVTTSEISRIRTGNTYKNVHYTPFSGAAVTSKHTFHEESGLTQRLETTRTDSQGNITSSSISYWTITLLGSGNNYRTFRRAPVGVDTHHSVYRIKNNGVQLEHRYYQNSQLYASVSRLFFANDVIGEKLSRIPLFKTKLHDPTGQATVVWYTTYEIVSYTNTELVILLRTFNVQSVLVTLTEFTYRLWNQ